MPRSVSIIGRSLAAALGAVVVAGSLLGWSKPTSAAWAFIGDPDTTDTATNGQGGLNQGTGAGAEIPGWLQDLLNLPSAPGFIASGGPLDSNSAGGNTITGLGSGILTIHNGQGTLTAAALASNLNPGNPIVNGGNTTYAFACSTGCGSFVWTNFYTTPNGILSDFRYLVPLPGAAFLFSSALAGLAWVRRRRGADADEAPGAVAA